ncbi:hypothetical protein CCF15_004324 [Escherichia albertii]|nr:hypothetical protein [Escherichia albertii]
MKKEISVQSLNANPLNYSIGLEVFDDGDREVKKRQRTALHQAKAPSGS